MDAGSAARLALTIAGGGLAAVVLATRTPPRAPQRTSAAVGAVLDALPGGNCGACGRATCFATAEAVASGRASVSACTAGGIATAVAVGDAMRRAGASPPAS